MPDIYVYTSETDNKDNKDFVGYAESGEVTAAVLCDGRGADGALASRMTVDSVIDLPYESADGRLWLSRRLMRADSLIKEERRRSGSDMSSCAAALRICGRRADWAHAGDVRLYYIRNDAIEEVTADHTVGFGKYIAGRIRRRDLRYDEDRAVVLRSVGGDGELRLDFGAAEVQKGDGFVLCTDGLWANLNDQDIVFDFLKADSAERWAELLLLRAADSMRPEGESVSLITIII